MNNSKEKDVLKEFLQKRIKENKELFSNKELEIIEKNINIFKKIYILGIKDVTNLEN